MTRDEILAADEATLREAIKAQTGQEVVGRRMLDGLRVLAARAFGVDLNPPDEGPAAEESGGPSEDRTSEPMADATPDSTNLPGAVDVAPISVSDDIADLPPPADGMTRVRLFRDYWPLSGEGREPAGKVLDLPHDEAKPLIRDGVVEWI